MRQVKTVHLVVAAVIAVTGCSGGTDPRPDVTPSGSAPSSAPARDVTRELAALEKRSDGRIGAFAIDIGSGATVGYRAGERFGMASTFKAVAAAAVLARASDDPGLMDEVVRYGRHELLPNSPVTQKHAGRGMTVADLCAAAVTVSDNTAANLLLDRIGGPSGLTRYFRSLGDTRSRLDHREPALNRWKPGGKADTTTPEAMARDLQRIVFGGALDAPAAARLTGWLKASTTGAGRIRAGLPGWTVGDKTGTPGGYGGAHDIAVAWPPSGPPVVLAVYTRGTLPTARPDDSVVARTAAVLVRALRPAP